MDERLPKLNEIVIGQVTKVMRFGAYCKLPEYQNLEVFVPLREVSFGWIKNIREHLHVGQKVVCKIIYFDRVRNTIDASIKRVTAKDQKEKINKYKLEKRLNALFLQLAKHTKQDPQALSSLVLSKFGTFTNMVKSALEKDKSFENLKIPKKLKEEMLETIESLMKKRSFKVSYIMTFLNYNTRSGATETKKIFSEIEKAGVHLTYITAPKYRAVADGKNYIESEKKVKKIAEIIQKNTTDVLFNLEKEKLKKDKESVFELYFK